MSTLVLELVSEEMHRRRHILLRKVQDSDTWETRLIGVFISMPLQRTKKTCHLSPVCRSWRPIAQRSLGRILVLFNTNKLTAEMVARSASILGSWTQEAHLCSTNTTVIGAEVWVVLEGLFDRSPMIQSLCFEAMTPDIMLYVRPTTAFYNGFWKLPPPPKFHDLAPFFESLDRLPEFECLALRGCLWHFRGVFEETMADFAEILGKTRTLAEFLRTVSKAPMRASSDSWRVIDFIHHVLFHFNHEQERFVTKALDIKDLGHTNPIDADASFFRFSELFCTELEALTYSGSCDFLALLAPFPRLTRLKAHVAFPAKRPHAVRKDLETMLDVLPPTLEIVQLKFRVNEPSMRQMLVAQPPDLNDIEIGPGEADEMLASIAESLCPELRTLGVDADGQLH